ncbi:MAG: peptidoglycan-binding protein [Ruminococcus flavefaciens]|nr:peptidoglycan-binding protein [Ruminococcus flavefaciens]
MADYRTMIVDCAKKYIGTSEPKGDDQFIEAYNKSTKAGFNMQTPWCAMFVTFCARMVGVPTTVIPNFASCRVSIDSFFKPKGRWHLRTSGYTPKPGDLIYYDWDKDKMPDHVGIVAGVESGKVITVEGNTSNPAGKTQYDGVYSKKVSLTSTTILGYVEPAYPGTTTTPSVTETKVSSLVKSTYIKKFQTWLNTTYKSGLTVDGVIGTNTKKAIIKAWQTQMNTSYKSKLAVDGIFGSACVAAANKHLVSQKTKATNLIYILQGLLYAHGYDPKGFDGIFGNGCLTAVKSLQKARSLEVDGIVGGATWQSLVNRW